MPAPVPRFSSRNVPRRPFHPTSLPLHPICPHWEMLADSSPGDWKPALNYLLCLPGRGGQVASPSQAPLPGQSRVAPNRCLCLGWGWTPESGERQGGAPGQVRPGRMRAACLPRAALSGKPTPSNRTLGGLLTSNVSSWSALSCLSHLNFTAKFKIRSHHPLRQMLSLRPEGVK